MNKIEIMYAELEVLSDIIWDINTNIFNYNSSLEYLKSCIDTADPDSTSTIEYYRKCIEEENCKIEYARTVIEKLEKLI